ncbi:MAG: pitrilysin family protein [Ignavibacteriaceae bacterium]|nr:pitrilysin family protein [Ignavibacteriaceae bacterium]
MNSFNKTVLPNGIRIISENIPYVQSFSLGFWFDVGSRDESKRNNGITHFIEHMLFKGTKKRSPRRIAEDIEAYGGYLNAFTSKENTCYYGRGLISSLPRTFDVISDMIQNSSFKLTEMKKEAGVVIDELNDIDDNPEELIFDKFEEILFSGNSLSMPIIGTEKNILGFSQKDLFSFIDNKYKFNNMLIVASGNIEHEKLLRLTDKYFVKDLGLGSTKRKTLSITPAPDHYMKKSVQQVHMIIGRSTYGYKDKKRITANILSHILGEGSSSRMFQTIREKNGIAYQVNSFLNSFLDVSSFGIYLSTNTKQSDKALSLVLNEFRKIREKLVSDKELKKAKEYIKGNIILSLESTTSRMFRIANSELYYNRMVTIDEITKMIDSVTAKEIIDIANEILEENYLTKIIISPKDQALKSVA